jgi:hypothetical protein
MQHGKKRELKREAAQYKRQLEQAEALKAQKQARARLAAKAEAEAWLVIYWKCRINSVTFASKTRSASSFIPVGTALATSVLWVGDSRL